MADQDTWLEDKVGQEVRVYIAVEQGNSLFGRTGVLTSVQENGIVIEDMWFNRSQIAYVQDMAGHEPRISSV